MRLHRSAGAATTSGTATGDLALRCASSHDMAGTDMTRTYDPDKGGYDVTDEPCYACGQLISYFLDEDGTPRDIQPRAVYHSRMQALRSVAYRDRPIEYTTGEPVVTESTRRFSGDEE